MNFYLSEGQRIGKYLDLFNLKKTKIEIVVFILNYERPVLIYRITFQSYKKKKGNHVKHSITQSLVT